MADAAGQQGLSPYHAMACNPSTMVDPLGLAAQFGMSLLLANPLPGPQGLMCEGNFVMFGGSMLEGGVSEAMRNLSQTMDEATHDKQIRELWAKIVATYGSANAQDNSVQNETFGAPNSPIELKEVSVTEARLEKEGSSATTAALAIAATASAADGPLPIGEIVGGVVLAGALAYDATQITFITYTLTGPNGEVYVGRSSGFASPEVIMRNRFATHHKRLEGYTNPQLDQAVQGIHGYSAIRGREQQMIDYFGGIGSPNVGNSIRGVSRYNPLGILYHTASNNFFGNIAPYTGWEP